MAKSKNIKSKKKEIQNVIDIAIQLAVLALMIGWCFQILRPFVGIILWAIIIAIAVFPNISGLAVFCLEV